MTTYLMSFLGGSLIGIAVSLMLYLNGRVTGVSGIIGRAFERKPGDTGWRVAFISGLFSGGMILRFIMPAAFQSTTDRSYVVLVIAGLLVGFGTVMGGGCTSGHGICGLSRLSRRSLVATIVFMVFGMVSATFYRLFVGAG